MFNPCKTEIYVYNFVSLHFFSRSWDSAVGIVTGYGLEDGGVGVRVPVGSRIFSSPHRSDRLLGRSSLLSSGYQGKAARAWSSIHSLTHTPSRRSAQ
jgi:hypothetical protein